MYANQAIQAYSDDVSDIVDDKKCNLNGSISEAIIFINSF
jgi:hypothetical protein